MRADSFITSPSWPVRTSSALAPSIEVASTKRTSPPVPVTASPVATPGTAVRSAASWKNFWRPSASRTTSTSTTTGGSTWPDAIRVAVLRRILPSSRSSWRTPASRVYSETTSWIMSSEIETSSSRSPFRSTLPRPEVVARDRGLLVDRVAVEADDLHPVEQRAGDRVGDVRGRDEEDVGEVELDVEVVVAERVVLRRVEHLEQRGRRVAAPVGADLVDLVEQDDRVHRLRRRAARGRAGPAASRCTCAGGRGSPPRRGCRRATCARTRG